MISEGSAFLDSSGRVVVADEGFRALLRLPDGDASEALRARSRVDPALAGFLAGDGPERISLEPRDAAPACELARTASVAGLLVVARARCGAIDVPLLELAIQALALGKLAGTVAHEVKNPLNAMVLQLALLGDKIGSASESLASACAGNIGSLKNQIGRINDLVRRYVEVADPVPAGGFDGGAVLADVTTLFGHEARRRRVVLACEAAPGVVRAAGDPARVARLLLGLLWRALTGTPEGGRLTARAGASGDDVVLSVEHAEGTADGALAWVGQVVGAGAGAMGGRFEESSQGGIRRAALVLPKERPL